MRSQCEICGGYRFFVDRYATGTALNCKDCKQEYMYFALHMTEGKLIVFSAKEVGYK